MFELSHGASKTLVLKNILGDIWGLGLRFYKQCLGAILAMDSITHWG